MYSSIDSVTEMTSGNRVHSSYMVTHGSSNGGNAIKVTWKDLRMRSCKLSKLQNGNLDYWVCSLFLPRRCQRRWLYSKQESPKDRFLTGLQRGYFFWREGAAIHTQATIKPCRQPLHATEPHVRLKHKLIQNIVPFWKTFVTKKKKKSTIFKWGLYNYF